LGPGERGGSSGGDGPGSAGDGTRMERIKAGVGRRRGSAGGGGRRGLCRGRKRDTKGRSKLGDLCTELVALAVFLFEEFFLERA